MNRQSGLQRLFCIYLLLSSVVLFQVGSVQAAFNHPGLLHSRNQLDLIKNKIAVSQEPWMSGYTSLCTHSQADYNYSVNGGYATVGRGNDPGDNVNKGEFDADCNAAHYNALMWFITEDQRHADKAIQILNAYSETLVEIIGTDKILMASLNGAKLLYAAEILRYTDAGWQADDVIRFESMMLNIFYPIIQDFATFANGNWGTGCVKTMMAIGVFCNNQTIFDRAVNWFYNGTGNGSLSNYIINKDGQCQESGRDQQHAQLGIAHLAEAAEIGWNQGLDLYDALNNRILKGFEYTAKYNLGFNVPFTVHLDTTGKYYHTEISPEGRGLFRPVYEMVFHHYRNRKNIACPYIYQVLNQIPPEGAGPYADCCGFGTVLFSLPPGDRFCGDEETTYLESDLNKDCYVSLGDFAILASEWLLGDVQ